MNKFRKRPLTSSQTLGERLQQLREEAGLSVDQVSQHLNIVRKHIISLEAGQYNELPGEIYVKNFLSKYASLLNVQEAAVLSRFYKEYVVNRQLDPRLQQTELPPKGLPRQLTFTPVTLRRIGLGLLVVAILVYLGWEVSKIVTPPPLALSEPPDNLVTEENLLTIVGQTEAEAIVTINKEQISVDESGAFSETIILEPGVNTVMIEAKKPRSRSVSVFRQILYQTNE
ncbi:MAG: helix-turn-helix domain-containing protein [Patescibacteria group bacterium]